ncbi:hypothetical protein RDI58_023406 [Solanum bulbocastanum]|jgi:hypothetical protein
MRRIQ